MGSSPYEPEFQAYFREIIAKESHKIIRNDFFKFVIHWFPKYVFVRN